MNKVQILALSLFTLISVSCKKNAGEGGTSKITGKIFVVDMDNKFEDTLGQYYSGKEDVYIVYGDDDIYGDKTETHHDGTFEFNFLYPGTYKVYCYSEDTSGTNQLLPIIKEIQIDKKKQEVEVEDIVIIK